MDWTILAVKLFDFLEKFQGVLAAILGGFLGYKLSWRIQRRERRLDRLSQQIKAFQELKIEFENSLPDLKGDELKQAIQKEDRLKKYGCLRLLGLRNELIPHIDSTLMGLIDNDLKPLYDRSKRGEANLKPEKINEFVAFVDKFKKAILKLEKKYHKQYEKLID